MDPSKLSRLNKLVKADPSIGVNLGSPEKRLMLAVLAEAISQWREDEYLDENSGVENWFRSDSRSWLYSFINICDVLDFAPSNLRRGLRIGASSHQAQRDVDRRKRGQLRRHRP